METLAQPAPAASGVMPGLPGFTHESGIHADGLAKHAATYESFDPAAEPGRERSVVLGKHSGSQSVRQAYDALGLPVSDTLVALLLTRIRHHATQHKQAPSAVDLYRFLIEVRDTIGEVSSACEE